MRRIKQPLLLAALFVVSAGVYNLCAFLLAEEYTEGFWVAYGFTMLAFIIQAVVPLVFVGKKSGFNDKFLSLPFAIYSDIYFGLQLIVGIILMLTNASLKVALIIEAVLLALFLLVGILVTIWKGSVSATDSKIVESTSFIRELSREAEMLYSSELNNDKKMFLKKLYETVRYADPVSSTQEIREIEEKILEVFAIIKTNVERWEMEELSQAVVEVEKLIKQRNGLCKLRK